MARKPVAKKPDLAPPPLRLEWRSPEELAENPKNWRRHPETQLAALTDVISEVGWAGACLFNERTGRLIDGHARRKVALEQGTPHVPVLVGSWDEAAEAKILATLDPLSAMAETDAASLDALLREVETGSQDLSKMLESLAVDAGLYQEDDEPAQEDAEPPATESQDQFVIIITCEDEPQQLALLDRLTAEGLNCRALLA